MTTDGIVEWITCIVAAVISAVAFAVIAEPPKWAVIMVTLLLFNLYRGTSRPTR